MTPELGFAVVSVIMFILCIVVLEVQARGRHTGDQAKDKKRPPQGT